MPGKSSGVTGKSVSTDSASHQTQNVSSDPVSVSPNELTNGVKRTLSKDSVDSDEIKKIKLIENDVNEKELGVSSSLNSKNDDEGNHIDIGKNLDQMTEKNSDEHSCVSNKTNNGENDITNNHVDDKAQNIGDDIIDKNKSTDVGGIDSEKKSSNTNNVNNNCGPTISKITKNGTKCINTSENGFVQDDQISNDDISQLKMSSSENVDDEGDFDKISLPTKTSVNKNCLSEKSEIRDGGDVQLSSASNTHQSTTENTNETIQIEIVGDHNNYTAEVVEVDDDCVFVDSLSGSDIDDDELLVNSALANSKKLCKRTYAAFLNLFSKNQLAFDAFESYVLQMIAAYSTTMGDSGRLRYRLQLLTAREKRWKTKYLYVLKQLKELSAVTKLHINETKANGFVKPHIITRTVGLQASMTDPKRNSAVQLPQSNTSSTQFNNELVDISSDGDDGDDRDAGDIRDTGNNGENDIIPINPLENTEPLNSNCIENKTKKKRQLPSSLTPAKDVPLAMPLLNVNDCTTTIDLTGPDELNIPQAKLNVEKSPIKIQRASHIGSSSQLGSAPLTTTVANLNTSSVTKTPVRPFVFKDGKLLPVQLSPVTVQKKIQPSPTISRQSLQPVPPSIPIVLKHPAPLPGLLSQKSLPSWKKIPPAPVISLSRILDSQKQKALVLSWNMSINATIADIGSYQIYSYQVISSEAPRTDLWRKIGDIKALPLPMACSLTKYMTGEKYFFAVRAIDMYNRAGPFSPPHSINP